MAFEWIDGKKLTEAYREASRPTLPPFATPPPARVWAVGMVLTDGDIHLGTRRFSTARAAFERADEVLKYNPAECPPIETDNGMRIHLSEIDQMLIVRLRPSLYFLDWPYIWKHRLSIS